MPPDQDFEVVRKAWEAARPDIRESLSFYREDIEIVPFGAALQGRVYRGHGGVVNWYDSEIIPNWRSFETIAEDFRRVGDQLLVFGHWRACARSGGVELNMPATWVVEVRDGKIARWQTFTDRGEAFAAVGLSEEDAPS